VDKTSAQNFLNFIAKIGSKVEICWKMEGIWWSLLNNSEVLSYLLGHILLFWKVTMQAFQKTSHFQEILALKKIVYGRCRGCLGHGVFWYHLFWWNKYFWTQ
jgi:hypothetical protein